jgi:hypothetical protein
MGGLISSHVGFPESILVMAITVPKLAASLVLQPSTTQALASREKPRTADFCGLETPF